MNIEAPVLPPPAADPATNDRESVTAIVQRLLQVYEWHGIVEGQIPRFHAEFDGPRLTFNDLSSTAKLVDRLDDELLDFVGTTFSLHPDWLRGGSSNVLTAQDFYKQIDSFPNFLLRRANRTASGFTRTLASMQGRASGTLYVIANQVPILGALSEFDPERYPDWFTRSSSRVHVGAIYKSQMGWFQGKPIYRYFPIEAKEWTYWRCQYQIVAIMAMADRLGAHVVGLLSGPEDDVFDLCGGRRFPTELINWGLASRTWNPQYPFLGSHAWANDVKYRERWRWFHAQFEVYDLPKVIDEAKTAFEKEVRRQQLDPGDVDEV